METVIIPKIRLSHWQLIQGLVGFAVLLVLVLGFHRHHEKMQESRVWSASKLWLSRNYVWMMISGGAIAFAFAVYNWLWGVLPDVGKLITLLTSEIANTPKANPAEPYSYEGIKNLAYAVGALIGAVAFAASIPFQLIKTWINERLAQTTEQGHITDRINKAVEQLGTEKTTTNFYDGGKISIQKTGHRYYSTSQTEPNLEVRLGAIYNLERIAQDSLRDHIRIMKILCAYIRNNAPVKTAVPLKQGIREKRRDAEFTQLEWEREIPAPRIDIQAVIDVLAARTDIQRKNERSPGKGQDKYALDLRDCNLQGIDLRKGNFDYAQLDRSNLDRVKGNKAKLNGAKLYRAKLNGAELNRAKLYWAELNETDLTACNCKGTAVRSVSLNACVGLTKDQVKSMFGDASVTLPDGMNIENDLPHWETEVLDYDDFLNKWRAWLNSPSFPPTENQS